MGGFVMRGAIGEIWHDVTAVHRGRLVKFDRLLTLEGDGRSFIQANLEPSDTETHDRFGIQ